MTANGWLQILVFLALILAVTKPMGVFMTRVFNRERTFMDPVLRPIERLLYRLTGVDENHEMRWTEYAGAMLLFSVVSMLLLYLIAARARIPAAQSAEVCSGCAGPGFQHRSVVHHQHQLAELFRRNHHELPDPDGGSRLPQLHLGGGRDRAGNRLHSRHRPPADADHRKLLGGHGSLHASGCFCRSASSAPLCSFRRESCRTSSLTTR